MKPRLHLNDIAQTVVVAGCRGGGEAETNVSSNKSTVNTQQNITKIIEDNEY